MSIPAITGLKADILPPPDWAISRWYYASPAWYYSRWAVPHGIVGNRRNYKLVDPELRPLCRLLNDRGLRTSASCQGHFHPPQHFVEVWDQLKREESAIQRLGLLVRDSELDDQYIFQNSEFALPWPDFEDFLGNVAASRGTGYVGVLIPLERPDVYELFQSISCSGDLMEIGYDHQRSSILGAYLFNFLLHPRDAEERSALWRQVTAQVHELTQHVEPESPVTALPAETAFPGGRIWAE